LTVGVWEDRLASGLITNPTTSRTYKPLAAANSECLCLNTDTEKCGPETKAATRQVVAQWKNYTYRSAASSEKVPSGT
jgi:hypothetical protein